MKQSFRAFIITIIQWQARMIIRRYKPHIVAVTGSVGKTGAKDAVYTALSQLTYVRKSKKSFNSEIGVPLTIIGAPTGWRDILKWLRNLLKGFWIMLRPFGRYPKWLVLEVGVGKPGDMEELKQWVAPDVVVVTAFGDMPSHVEFFESKEDVWKEEASIMDALKPDGVLILNHDDERVLALKEGFPRKVITYGFDENADIRIEHHEVTYDEDSRPTGTTFRIDYQGKSLPVNISDIVGTSVAYYAAAGLAVVLSQDENMIQAIDALRELQVPQGRLRLIDGIHDSIIIDDTYNSSPPALKHALETLNDLETSNRKIAVIGDMLELGKFSDEEHEKLGKYAGQFCDIIVTVGVRSKAFAEGARNAGVSSEAVFESDDFSDSADIVRRYLRTGDIVLVKGSQSVRLEKTVKAIMKCPEDAKDLLCRQEREWLEKE